MLNFKFFFVLISALCIVGCSRQSSERYLIRHPAELKYILDRCETMGPSEIRSDQKCLFAYDVYRQAVKFTHAMMASPEAFGKSIIQSQQKLAAIDHQIKGIRKQLKQTNEEEVKLTLSNQLQKLQDQNGKLTQQINIKLELVAIAEGM